MKKKITFYELLTMMKNGTAPKKVYYDSLEWVLHEKRQEYYNEGKSLSSYYADVMYMGEFVVGECIFYEETILTEKEKSYLSAVLKPFKKHKLTITKEDASDGYNIIVMTGDGQYYYFPIFSYESGMYKGMEVDKKYTPSELGLWDEE